MALVQKSAGQLACSFFKEQNKPVAGIPARRGALEKTGGDFDDVVIIIHQIAVLYVGIAGTEAVYADTLGCVIDGHGLGQQNDTAFGSAVRNRFISAHDSPSGTVVDDHTASLLDHRRQDELGHQKRSFEVDIDGEIPLLFRAVDSVVRKIDTGIIKQVLYYNRDQIITQQA